jgi:hypothetical protein
MMQMKKFFDIKKIENIGDSWIAYLALKKKRRSHWTKQVI